MNKYLPYIRYIYNSGMFYSLKWVAAALANLLFAKVLSYATYIEMKQLQAFLVNLFVTFLFDCKLWKDDSATSEK